MKVCKYCHRELPLDSFPHYKGSKDGHHWQCKECKAKFNKQRYEKKKEELLEKQKEYYAKRINQPGVREALRERASVNNKTDAHKKARDKYNAKFSTKKKKADYEKRRKREDPSYKIKIILRRRLYNLITSKNLKEFSSLDLLSCSLEFFKKHIESQFEEGMSWDNYGSYWHLDHIVPCAYFNLSDPKQQKICFNWRNFQPLKKEENLKNQTKSLIMQEL